MVVQHNLTAMNSNRMLGLTTASQAKSTEKLSSGYKINRAADDAAGLSISEKMRKQIRGLTQASSNAQDGISTVQTAEGALNEVQDMLQRMNELAVKSANGTNSETDRSYIQNEIDQLVTEIDRVSETTKFNETYLLKGDDVSKSGNTAENIKIGGATANNVTLNASQEVKLGDYAVGTVAIKKTGTVDTSANQAITATTANTPSTELKELMNKSADGKVQFKATMDAATADANGNNAVTWTAYAGDGTTSLGKTYTTAELATLGIDITRDDTKKIAKDDSITFEKELVQSQKQITDLSLQGITTDFATGANNAATAAGLKDIKVGSDLMITVKNDNNGVAHVSAYDKSALVSSLKLSLHVGADSTTNNKIETEINTMSAKGLGLRTDTGEALKVDGKDSTNADAAIDTIAAAIQKVSTQRSALGAVQNRLEHTISNLDNVVENTTSAESQIRDTDMATEMVKYSNNNILAQAGQAMLAQANQSNQGVLSLLQ